jgi:inner membrane protein
MNLLSYMLLGAVVGGFVAVRTIGNRALIIGAIVATIPCLDELIAHIAFYFGHTYSSAYFHSIVCLLVASPLVAWILSKLRPDSPYSLAKRCMLVFWVLSAHIVLDIFTISGVQIFAPFSSWRIAVASIAPVDLFFSFLLFAGIVITLIVKQCKLKIVILWCSLFFTALYLAFSVINKLYIKTEFEYVLQQNNLPHSRIGVFPIAGSNFKWNCIAQNHHSYWQGYFSNFSCNNADFNTFTQNNRYSADFKNHTTIQSLTKATDDFYHITDSFNVASQAQTISITDLRYTRKTIDGQLLFSRSYTINTQNNRIQQADAEDNSITINQP